METYFNNIVTRTKIKLRKHLSCLFCMFKYIFSNIFIFSFETMSSLDLEFMNTKHDVLNVHGRLTSAPIPPSQNAF